MSGSTRNDRMAQISTSFSIEEERFRSGGYLLNKEFRLEISIDANPEEQQSLDDTVPETVEQTSRDVQEDNVYPIELVCKLHERQNFQEDNASAFAYHKVCNFIFKISSTLY